VCAHAVHRLIRHSLAAHRVSEFLGGEIPAGRETSKLVQSRAMEAHQRMQDLVGTFIGRADNASESPDTWDCSDSRNRSDGHHAGSGRHGGDRGDSSDSVAEADQERRVCALRRRERTKVHVSHMVHG
jgi:hypothetical protein